MSQEEVDKIPMQTLDLGPSIKLGACLATMIVVVVVVMAVAHTAAPTHLI